MQVKYVTEHVIRAIYILIAVLLSINIILLVAVITNTTGLFPASFYHDATLLYNAKIKLINILILFIIWTVMYLLAEYALHKKLVVSLNKPDALDSPSKVYATLMSYFYFIIFSFLNFLVTLHFISINLLPIIIFTTLLNLIPIYLIDRIMLHKIKLRNIRIIFWLTTIVISVVSVYPFGLVPFIRLFLL